MVRQQHIHSVLSLHNYQLYIIYNMIARNLSSLSTRNQYLVEGCNTMATADISFITKLLQFDEIFIFSIRLIRLMCLAIVSMSDKQLIHGTDGNHCTYGCGAK